MTETVAFPECPSMKVDLVYPDVSSFHGLPYHPGLASIAAVLKAGGHDVVVHYFDTAAKMNDVLAAIARRKPDIVGFTAVETQFPYVRTLAKSLKTAHRCALVCGGVYTTLFPEVVAEQGSPFDAVIMGEGEMAMADFVSRVGRGEAWTDLSSLAYRHPVTGSVVRNPLRPLTDNLDLFPPPAIELFSYQEIINRHNIALFHFNRGCPYHCTFCSNEALGKVYGMPANRMRYRTVESVMSEIRSTLKRYAIEDNTMLCFQDDLFTSNKKWITDFCAVYKDTIGRPFWCTGRSNQLTDEICGALKKAGCVTLMMSVESGNDYIRNEVMKRGISRQTLIGSFELCHRHGINTMASSIIGLPFETPEMIEDSIRTMASLKSISTYGINTFYPYKGTVLRRICEEEGFMSADATAMDGFEERRDSVLNLPTISKEQIRYYNDNWIKLIMRHKSASERVKYWIWVLLDGFRKSRLGMGVRSVVNSTIAGKKLKRYVLDIIQSRYQ